MNEGDPKEAQGQIATNPLPRTHVGSQGLSTLLALAQGPPRQDLSPSFLDTWKDLGRSTSGLRRRGSSSRLGGDFSEDSKTEEEPEPDGPPVDRSGRGILPVKTGRSGRVQEDLEEGSATS